MSWIAEPIWNNQTVYIIGGGPSVNDMDLSPIFHCNVIGVNNAFELGDWVDICWSGDGRWLDWNQDKLSNYPGLIISCAQRLRFPKNVLSIKRGIMYGIDTRPGYIAWNRSSGASAINMAVHLGASKIILIGFDMKCKDGQHQWHNHHSHIPRSNIYSERFLPVFPKIKSDLDSLNITCLNATPESALHTFKSIIL